MDYILAFCNRKYVGEQLQKFLEGERISLSYIYNKLDVTENALDDLLKGTINEPRKYIIVLLILLDFLETSLDEVLNYEIPELTILERIKCLEDEEHPLAEELNEQYKLLENLVSLCEEYDMEDLH